MMKRIVLVMCILIMLSFPAMAQFEEDMWTETITALPEGTPVSLSYVEKGDLLEGNLTSDGGAINFYVMLENAFMNQFEYGAQRVDVPIYKANLVSQNEFSIPIPFDGTLVIIFDTAGAFTPVNVTYSLNYVEDGAAYLREGRTYDDFVVLTPSQNTIAIPIPYVFIGDRIIFDIYSLDGSVNVYAALDSSVDREKLPTYYREIYPLISASVLNEIITMDQLAFASGTLILYINNPNPSSNRSVVYHLQCIERGPIMRVFLIGLENGRIILPLGFTLSMPFEELTGAAIQFTLQVYEFFSRAYDPVTNAPLIGPIIGRLWALVYNTLMPLWAY